MQLALDGVMSDDAARAAYRRYVGMRLPYLQLLRLLLQDGRQICGADVYRYVLRRIWWAFPLYVFAVVPLGRQVFDWGYRTFARNRFIVSQTCGLGDNR